MPVSLLSLSNRHKEKIMEKLGNSNFQAVQPRLFEANLENLKKKSKLSIMSSSK